MSQTPQNIKFVNLISGSDLMKATSIGRETLRHYEEKGLIKPISRTASGYRRYSPNAADVIAFIKSVQQAGFALKEIRELLQLRATAQNTCDNVSKILGKKRLAIDEEIRNLERKRDLINAMIADCCAVNDCKP